MFREKISALSRDTAYGSTWDTKFVPWYFCDCDHP